MISTKYSRAAVICFTAIGAIVGIMAGLVAVFLMDSGESCALLVFPALAWIVLWWLDLPYGLLQANLRNLVIGTIIFCAGFVARLAVALVNSPTLQFGPNTGADHVGTSLSLGLVGLIFIAWYIITKTPSRTVES
jgi:hypothetical protein